MLECPICLEYPRVPVKLLCFSCGTVPGRPSCNSLQRLCLLCARAFLELNKARQDRITFKKCLLCPAVCRPAQLTATTAYEKDFLLMSLDEGTQYPCFYDTCGFRGTQNQLDHHIGSECQFRNIWCHYCRKCFPVNDAMHKANCSGFECCPLCLEYIEIRDYASHLSQCHDLTLCRYCNMVIPQDRSHEKLCPFKKVQCRFCSRVMLLSSFYDHHRMELVDKENLVQQLEEQKNQILFQLKAFRNAEEAFLEV